MEDQADLLTVLDVGRLVGLGPDAVRLAIKRGELPFVARTPRGVYLVSRAAAEEFARARRESGLR